jgi:ATP-dependent Lhr-like helicase
MSGMFGRLSPFIQDYIYTHRWDELREIQVEACKVIFDSDNHLLLASGTASGKTEAAFLPVLTDITNNPSSSIAVLYIAPIKALINDQFVRLNDLLKEADIPVWHWHGDVSPTHKKRMLNNPTGILQITPESLENMLLNKGNELIRLFHDLRYVIIDEVHSFMSSDRGMQILCQLERLHWHTKVQPRRIGLSATLGDYSLAEKWLASGTDRRVSTPTVNMGSKNIRLAVEHFYD